MRAHRAALALALALAAITAACTPPPAPIATPPQLGGAHPDTVTDEPQPTLRLPRHFVPTGYTARLAIDPARPGFSAGFPRPDAVDALYREVYLDVHRRFIESRPPMRQLLL